MIRAGFIIAALLAASLAAYAAPAKTHVTTFGKWTVVQWIPDTGDVKPAPLKVRPLLIDGRVKEYTLGSAHEVTDRLFVVRRAFRVNDNLPEESSATLRWQWQRGGWLLVDRLTGHVSVINLPDFDAFYSLASWYRDYVAYCGVDDGRKMYAIVAQINRRKPLLKKLVSASLADGAPADSACPSPSWQRAPARVTFEASGTGKQTFAIRGHVVDVLNDAEEDEEASK